MHKKTAIMFVFVFLLSSVLSAQADQNLFTVLPWNGHQAAVSLTYDDGDPVHLDLVIPEMQKRGMTGTFFLIAGNIQRIDDWKKAAAAGMEIGNHSMTHRHASELSAAEEKTEIDSADKILRELSGRQVLTFAYPFVEITDGLRAAIEKKHILARGGYGPYYYTPVMAPDWYDISSQGTMTEYKFDIYKGWIDQALSAGAWTVFMVHAIEGSDWFQPVPKDVFIKTLDYLKEKNSDIWTAPLGEIGAYWKAQKAIEAAERKKTGSGDIFTWKKPAVFPNGVLIRIKLNGVNNTVTQDGKKLELQKDGSYIVEFDKGKMTVGMDGDLKVNAADERKPGFYTDGKKILAPGGEEVVFRGINKMFVWTDKEGATLPEIAKTGANSVRIVWTIKDGTQEELDKIITKCIENNMIPIIELHDKTCKWDDDVFKDLTAYWTHPETVKLIKKHEKYLFINYGNEIGTWTVSAEEYEKKYSEAIRTMRKAGIHVPIIIDAPKCGQDMNMYIVSADNIVAADPDKNVIYSVHMWWTDNDPIRIQDAFMTASFVKAPLIVGEFAAMGIGCSSSIAYKTIMEECAKNNTGWLAWSWGPGNSDCAAMDMTKDGKFDTLYGWGKEAAVDDKFSIKNTSKIPEYVKQIK